MYAMQSRLLAVVSTWKFFLKLLFYVRLGTLGIGSVALASV
jgi:hypothetical protein